MTDDEFEILKSQFATSSWGGRRKKPYAFTESGVAMLSAILRSDIAIKMERPQGALAGLMSLGKSLGF